MYYQTVRQFARTLRSLDAIMEKAEKHAETKKFNPDNFLTSRIAPDMLPFAAQIRIACDSAKGSAANLSGKTAPKHEDTEKTFAELRGRIAKCLEYLDTFKPEDFMKASPTQIVPIPFPPGKSMRLEEYFFARQIPNFFFHVTTAYNLLRAGGVEIGKTDYLGTIEILDS